MSADGVAITTGEPERLAGYRDHVLVEVSQHEPVPLEEALVPNEIPHRRRLPPARVVAHPGVRPEPANREPAHHQIRPGSLQRRYDVLTRTGRVAELHLACWRPAHSRSVHPRTRRRDKDTPLTRKRDKDNLHENLQQL